MGAPRWEGVARRRICWKGSRRSSRGPGAVMRKLPRINNSLRFYATGRRLWLRIHGHRAGARATGTSAMRWAGQLAVVAALGVTGYAGWYAYKAGYLAQVPGLSAYVP